MPSRESTQGRPKVDRSTSPLSRQPAASPVTPVQELKALFAEPVTSNSATSNGEKESDFRFEAIQCLRQSSFLVKRTKDLPERGNWSSKVKPSVDANNASMKPRFNRDKHYFFFFLKDRIYFVRRGIGHRFGKPVAISLPLLQEWRRCFHGTLFHRACAGRYTHVPDGAVFRTNADDRRSGCLQNSTAL